VLSWASQRLHALQDEIREKVGSESLLRGRLAELESCLRNCEASERGGTRAPSDAGPPSPPAVEGFGGDLALVRITLQLEAAQAVRDADAAHWIGAMRKRRIDMEIGADLARGRELPGFDATRRLLDGLIGGAESRELVLRGRRGPYEARNPGTSPAVYEAPRVTPFPDRRRRVAAPVVLAAVVAALFGALSLERPGAAAYTLPFTNPTAIARYEGEFWMADWVTRGVYLLELRRGRAHVLRSVAVPGAHITGLAVAGDAVYTCDSWKRVIQKRALDGPLTVVTEVPSPGPSPSGLHFDGRSLWSCDGERGRIYRHRVDGTLSVADEYPSPAGSPVGLFWDGENLWSADAGTRSLYRHRMDERLTVAEEYALPALGGGREPISAVAYERGDVWLAQDGRNELLRFRLERDAVRPRAAWRSSR
jgi:hypothetical protein